MKIQYRFPDGGPELPADATKAGALVIHAAPRKGYCLTEAATGLLVAHRRLLGEVRNLRKLLEPAARDEWPGILARQPEGGEGREGNDPEAAGEEVAAAGL